MIESNSNLQVNIRISKEAMIAKLAPLDSTVIQHLYRQVRGLYSPWIVLKDTTAHQIHPPRDSIPVLPELTVTSVDYKLKTSVCLALVDSIVLDMVILSHQILVLQVCKSFCCLIHHLISYNYKLFATLFVFVCLCVCVCVFVFVCLFLCFWIIVYLCFCIFCVFVFLCFCVFVCIFKICIYVTFQEPQLVWKVVYKYVRTHTHIKQY